MPPRGPDLVVTLSQRWPLMGAPRSVTKALWGAPHWWSPSQHSREWLLCLPSHRCPPSQLSVPLRVHHRLPLTVSSSYQPRPQGWDRGGGLASCCPGSLPCRVRGTRHCPLEGPAGASFGSKRLERTALAWSGGMADGPGFPVSPGRLEDRGHCGIEPRCPVQPCLLHPVHCSPGHQPLPLLLPTAGLQATGSSWTFPISPQSLGAQLSFRIQPENPT